MYLTALESTRPRTSQPNDELCRDPFLSRYFELSEADINSILSDDTPRVIIDLFIDVDDGKKYKGQWYL